MTTRGRVIVFVSVAAIIIVATVGYGVSAFQRHRDAVADAPKVSQTDYDTVASGPHIVFRNTAIGSSYGLVAAVALSDPSGSRAIVDVACDRVDATETDAVCLQTHSGMTTSFSGETLDENWKVTDSWPLPGIPSRTRLSPDGTLLATTSFVSGHSYMTVGFSTATVISKVGGSSYGNLESFDLTVDGTLVTAKDLNVWGVTFANDDNTFYATASSGGHDWLVRGDLAQRSMTSIHDQAECPSLSPDQTHVAYKKNIGGSTKHWSIAVLDLATGNETVLAEQASVDDQVEWLDDDTLLYGLPRAGEAGVTDVWSIGIEPDSQPTLFIPQAWSPSVVR